METKKARALETGSDLDGERRGRLFPVKPQPGLKPWPNPTEDDMNSGHITIDVDVLDQDECPTGQSVPVELCYLKDVDRSYGEDADGLRATTLVSYEILDHYIDPVHLAGLNSWQVERLIKDADTILQEKGVDYV